MNRNHFSFAKGRGFSLIEVIIAMAILAILAAVALGVYTSQIVKTRRTDGATALVDLMAKQERYYSLNNSYVTDLTDLGYDAATNVDSDEGYYKLSAAACTSSTITSCVQLTATPQGGQASDDTECGNLTYNSRGQKGISGTGSVGDCW